jgi:hypothetical protein
MNRTVFGRAASLARVLSRDPREFADRVAAIVAGRVEVLRLRAPSYAARDFAGLVDELVRATGNVVRDALAEPRLAQLEAAVLEGRTGDTGGIDPRHNGDVLLARTCWALTRALRPQVVLETGVARGVTSSFILGALDMNGSGELHSIDLPPHDVGAEDQVGALVPPDLRSRWTLHRGLVRRVLPGLVARLGSVDLFVHDSLHTYRNMSFEFATVWPALCERGAVVADDVEGNAAFLELQQRGPRLHTVCREATKTALFGVALR